MSKRKKVFYWICGICVLIGSFYLNFLQTQQISNMKMGLENLKAINQIEKNETIFKIDDIFRETTILSAFIQAINPKCDKQIAAYIASAIINKSQKRRIFYGLLIGIIGAESAFNPYECSTYGARGLMQVANRVHKKFDAYKLHDVDYNIDAGIDIYMEILQRKNGDHIATLLEYVYNSNDYVMKVHRIIGFYFTFRDAYLNYGKVEATLMLSKNLNDVIYVKRKNK